MGKTVMRRWFAKQLAHLQFEVGLKIFAVENTYLAQAKEKPEKFFNGIGSLDHCDAGSVFYRLSYEAKWVLAILRVRNKPVEDGDSYEDYIKKRHLKCGKDIWKSGKIFRSAVEIDHFHRWRPF